ncbi:MAG TPA: helix-turn-helix transcriptional regulator [Actinospica sp.]|jgi:hypothetical protein|nr:helix-turn-helix transcriptional regulator [Actinospica sp.]
MSASGEAEPGDSFAAFFGSELRRIRSEQRNMTQEDLGNAIHYTGAQVGMVELAKRTPSRQFAEECDRALQTDGYFARLWPFLNPVTLPSWFRGYVELEAAARRIQTFECQNVPGLLQTEGYARAVLSAGRPEDIEERVAARISRQRILAEPTAPLLWAVVDEAVLHRPVGGPDVMREQLKRLVDATTTRQIVLQVLPFRAGAHACMNGALSIVTPAEGPDVVYVEDAQAGRLFDRPDQVEKYQLRYDLVRAAALSPDESVTMIEALMEET